MRLKPGKLVIRLISGIAILLIAIFFSISPITKYMIEKNSEAWTGRKITMESLFINILNRSVTVKNLRIYEFKRNDVFFSASRLHTELSFLPLLRGEYLLKTVQLVSPSVVIEQKGEHFNYDDLVKRFASEDTLKKTPEPPSGPVKYHIEAIVVTGGNITYRDKLLNHEIVIQNFGLACPVIAWNENNIRIKVGFSFKSGGKVSSSIALNIESLAYTVNTKVKELDLQLVYPYMKAYMKTSYAGAMLSSDLIIKGDLDTPQAVAFKGNINLAGFRLDDAQNLTVASWKNFNISIDSLDVAANIYTFGEITLDEPYMLVEMFASDNNFTRMMTPTEGETTDSTAVDAIDYSNPFTIITGYIKEISKDYIISNYTVEKAEILNGHILYNDYTPEDRFTYDLEEFNIKSGRIDSRGDSITFAMACLSNLLGRLNAYLAFDPKDYKNMTFNCTIDQMRISDFNPYSRFYVAHAFVEGLLHYASTNIIHNGKLSSTNKMHIEKIEVSRRIPGKGLYAMPLRLAIVLLRDKHGNIDLDIPVEGNLNDPKYKLGKVIWKVLGNIVVKAATAPFTILAKAFGANEEDLKMLRFDYMQKSFDKQQLNCRLLKGEVWLNQQVEILFDTRNRFIMNYLVNEKHVDPVRIKITNTADEKAAQFESTPRYAIDFFVEE